MRRRSSLTGPDHARFAQAALRLPYLNRIVLRAPEAVGAAGATIRRRPRSRSGPASAAFICVGETCSLPVADPDKIADVVAAMRPARSA